MPLTFSVSGTAVKKILELSNSVTPLVNKSLLVIEMQNAE
jgi:hypothetical protein